MRDLYRILFALVIVVAVLVVLKILPTRQSIPDFTIETTSSTCMSEEHALDIRAVGNSIVITAPIQTPTPCYSIVGDVKISVEEIEVDLSTVSKQNACIQCVGEVTGKVIIQNLTKGVYGVKVNTPDKATITTIMIE